MNTLAFEAKLAEQYHYKKLPLEVSKMCRELYQKNIPSNLFINGGNSIYTFHGTLIANYYNRIVIGDYGAFIEIQEINKDKLIIQLGQEYRSKEGYSNIKYEWLTYNDGSNIKIYYQKNIVDYADYQPGMYYVSVHEVLAKS